MLPRPKSKPCSEDERQDRRQQQRQRRQRRELQWQLQLQRPRRLQSQRQSPQLPQRRRNPLWPPRHRLRHRLQSPRPAKPKLRRRSLADELWLQSNFGSLYICVLLFSSLDTNRYAFILHSPSNSFFLAVRSAGWARACSSSRSETPPLCTGKQKLVSKKIALCAWRTNQTSWRRFEITAEGVLATRLSLQSDQHAVLASFDVEQDRSSRGRRDGALEVLEGGGALAVEAEEQVADA